MHAVCKKRFIAILHKWIVAGSIWACYHSLYKSKTTLNREDKGWSSIFTARDLCIRQNNMHSYLGRTI